MKIKTLDQAKYLGLHTYSYTNGDGEYTDTNNELHLIKGEENE